MSNKNSSTTNAKLITRMGPIMCQVKPGDRKDFKMAEMQFRQQCICEEPLYMSQGLPQQIALKTKGKNNNICLKLSDISPEMLQKQSSDTGGEGDDTSPPHVSEGNIGRVNMPQLYASLNNMRGQSRPKGKSPGNKDKPEKSTSSIYGMPLQALKVYNYGERGSGTHTQGPPQDFYHLRNACLNKKRLFEDPEFPADDASLFFNPEEESKLLVWKRPHELVDNPQLFVAGFSRFDVQQGDLGDCWLLAATANLTMSMRTFSWVVPDDQGFEPENYAGIFHFRFWHYGRWIDVTIDDRVPTHNGQLVFLHSTEDNEFWSALMEKAYAKLYGCYDALKGGSTSEAMEDFTGGVVEIYDIRESPKDLFQIMVKGYERNSLMGCSIEPDPEVLEAETPEGLVRGHAYSVTKVKEVVIDTPNVKGVIPLLRVRNPWGNELEWNGAWSDGAEEWRYITDAQKIELGLSFEDDGEFWMCFADFQKYFDRLEMCNLNPDSMSEEAVETTKKKWEMSIFEGEWVAGVTAGGCRNFLDTFWHNPQYRVTLIDPDENDDETNCTLIVALMQKHRRRRRSMVEWLTIGFSIYYLADPEKLPKPLDYNFFKYNSSVARSPSFVNTRETSSRFKLPPGTYCIVPTTFDPDEEGEFLVRVFSEHANNMQENEQDISHTLADHEFPAEEGEDQELTKKVQELFLRLAGEDEELDWTELKEILDFTMQESTFKGFSKDICRSMIAMVDFDRSGKLNYYEFTTLWFSMKRWRAVFKQFDEDNDGKMTGREMRAALDSAGYRLNSRILNMLMHRYGNKNREIEFDDFINLAIKLKTMIDLYEHKRQNNEDVAFFIEEFIECTLYS